MSGNANTTNHHQKPDPRHTTGHLPDGRRWVVWLGTGSRDFLVASGALPWMHSGLNVDVTSYGYANLFGAVVHAFGRREGLFVVAADLDSYWADLKTDDPDNRR